MSISILGLNIKRIREEKGISAYRLAKDANVGVSTISQIETGKRQSLNSKTAEKIATTLGVSVDELMTTETDVEYVVTDIEQTIKLILSSDELVLDDIELNGTEKLQIESALNATFAMIRSQRNGR
ncbi:helix-turn-helix transcriptional regulator [Clostridium botulinum]|uniref:helix-turn-helix domain-containing protein n=1 Tax=Clostridium botulinum TaxID=1491 RepID=UPI000A171784|nr:helix-turn-helix transcriptional regulator [Clostridium botulinum]MBO0572788.1 XRE family transcriptional regulator [Clostridium botulinum]NFJ61701.1 helix-turn-helix transcriptional regulator [Clostridium botulinum]NFQ62440.1 helix-turn-helix transcriptional regulator [Clostridium botulinum]NFR19264.1 helix-turn-helix transcriptional regulator [Clostridium botulinum]NFU18276.1 helix-turn-helix transcriptional regulator [Clostridium botulinum]